jgi:hypothetical protein
MQTLFFRVKIGYRPDEFIPITGESELEKAMAAFTTNSKAVFERGVVRGQDIIAITEDWHREMGWNQSHVMEDEDWSELKSKGIKTKYEGIIASAKIKVEYLIRNKREDLIGKNFEIPKIENKEIYEGVKSLADKFKIK